MYIANIAAPQTPAPTLSFVVISEIDAIARNSKSGVMRNAKPPFGVLSHSRVMLGSRTMRSQSIAIAGAQASA